MKRITAPKTWSVQRKTSKFITKPKPGAHKLEQSVAINTFFKELAHVTNTTKESKYVLTFDEVLVNGRRRRDFKTPVGFLDVITIKSTKKNFLITVDNKGALKPKELDEKLASQRLLKITNKHIIGKDKVQINTMNGENLLVSDKEAKKYKLGDSLIVEVGSLKVLEHVSFKEGGLVFVYVGKHAGKSGELKAVSDKSVTIKNNDDEFETSKDYLLAVNKEKIVEFELK